MRPSVPGIPRLPFVPDVLRRSRIPADLDAVTDVGSEVDPDSVGVGTDNVETIWKSVVFMEGNYKRAVTGATDDPYLRQFGDGVVELAEQAQELAMGGREL